MIPGVIIAGPHSGAGKTTVTLGIMSLLVKRGYQVQGFKVGPDYIDPSFYRGITGRAGENLDSWMTSPNEVRRIYREAGQGADFAIVEGVMGLFDGAKGDDEIGSTAHIAKILDLPIILVIDVHSMARSVGAVIKGFREFDLELRFGGIIFNRVGSERHLRLLTEAAKTVTEVKFIGYLPKDITLTFPERHLGLVPFYENQDFQQQLDKFAALFAKTIKLDDLLNGINLEQYRQDLHKKNLLNAFSVRIGIARDEAFGFYYEDNLRLLRQAGAELVEFSPLKDELLPPDLNGLYIGGGYPEMFARQLAANKRLKAEIKAVIQEEMPVYAECGGLMYLTEQIATADGTHPMIGALKLKVEMTNRREALGYAEVTSLKDNLLLKKGQIAKGHEFHYSRIVSSQEEAEAYTIKKMDDSKEEGFVKGNLLASYVHLHFASNPEIARNFVEKCLEFRGKGKEKEN